MDRGKREHLAVIVTVAILAVTAYGQDSDVAIQQALDKPVGVELTNARIGEVLTEIGQAAGVKLVIDQDAIDALPYGDQTRLDVTLKNATLRKALSPILARQALRWEIDGEAIRVLPTTGLKRMCRRATFEELDLLGTIYSAKLQSAADGRGAIDQLRAITGRTALGLVPHVKLDAPIITTADRALPCTAANWLDMLCHGHGWTWRLRGDQIAILHKAAQVASQLERRVTLSYRNASLVTVLLDLASKGDAKLTLAPGVLNYLSPATRDDFNLIMGEASIQQALEVISGATGLKFVVTAEGIRTEASEALLAQGQRRQRGRQRPGYFVRLSVPGPSGTNMELFLRPEELPEDVAKLIERAKDEFIEKLRDEAAAELAE